MIVRLMVVVVVVLQIVFNEAFSFGTSTELDWTNCYLFVVSKHVFVSVLLLFVLTVVVVVIVGMVVVVVVMVVVLQIVLNVNFNLRTNAALMTICVIFVSL